MADGRDRLLELGEILKPARDLRYLPPSTFDDVDVDDLERGERALRAIAYSCATGARLLRRILEDRRSTSSSGNPVTSEATS